MSSNDSASQDTLFSTFYVSTIDVGLARDSKKRIESIKLRKNDESLRDVQKTICAGGVHREEFSPLLALDPGDRISVSVHCSLQLWKRIDVPIDINLRDVECMRDEQGARSYRKKARNVEVVVAGHQSLLATTTPIIQSCSQFRLLVIGNSGVGKSTLIHKVFGVENVHTSETSRGEADIDREFISPTNDRFVVHDSLGFEAADEQRMDMVKQFVARRKAMPQLKDQLHAIWLCLEIPNSGGRLLEAGAERFLERRGEILGQIPLVVVLTKVDLLNFRLELELPTNETLEHFKSRHMNEHCIRPLHKAAGSDLKHVTVSVEYGYSESLSNLVEATNEVMVEYDVDEAPQFMASIAQRISIKRKIELSIAVGKKKYWTVLLKSAVFRDHTLKEHMQVIHKDVIAVWNFNDPDQCLMNDNIESLLYTDNLGNMSDAPPPNMTSFAGLLASGLDLPAGGATPVVQTTHATFRKAKKDMKILIAYIVDLICVMQIIFLLASGNRVTPMIVLHALRAYKQPKRLVHQSVHEFHAKLGVLPGGRDRVMDEIETLIWRHSITDHEVEELRRRIGKVSPSGSS